MIILTVRNKYGYKEELAWSNKSLNDILDVCKGYNLTPLTVKDTSCIREVFTIKF